MHDDTLLTTLGRHPDKHDGIVNPPVYRASTILFPTLADLERPKSPDENRYGRYGTETTRELEQAVASLEGGAHCIVTGSGKAAIVGSLLALLKPGEHLLMADSVYAPTRFAAQKFLKRWGVDTTFYDPALGGAIDELIRPETRVVYAESPGSLTFEVQDLPAIADAAHAKDCLVVFDNTWASPLYFKAFEHGADVVIQAGTKYIGGHSDLMMGFVTTTDGLAEPVRLGIEELGGSVSPADCWLALRGLRTLSVRLERHYRNALVVANWLLDQPQVLDVLYPALPEDPSHSLWRRDFRGASGLFGMRLIDAPKEAVAAMLDQMELFGMGYSWGGYESLLIPSRLTGLRTATRPSDAGILMRLHIGLEEPADLIEDLEAGFTRFDAAR